MPRCEFATGLSQRKTGGGSSPVVIDFTGIADEADPAVWTQTLVLDLAPLDPAKHENLVHPHAAMPLEERSAAEYVLEVVRQLGQRRLLRRPISPKRLSVNGSARRSMMATEEKQEGKMDMQAMMEVYKKLATPGAPHKMLANLAGTWITKTRAWMEPDKPPMEGTGTCEQRMLFEGRYLQQEYTGEMTGSPFIGINVLGYDNHTKKYVSTWIDSMSTGIYFFEGTGSADGKTITQESSYDDPVVFQII